MTSRCLTLLALLPALLFANNVQQAHAWTATLDTTTHTLTVTAEPGEANHFTVSDQNGGSDYQIQDTPMNPLTGVVPAGCSNTPSYRLSCPAATVETVEIHTLDLDDSVEDTSSTPTVKVYGGDGNDTFTGGKNTDLLDGGTGNDTLSGGDGTDTLTGGPGEDVLTGGNQNDIVSGGDGNDTVNGSAGNDNLNGDNGADEITGGEGNDTANGGDDADSLDGGGGNDTLTGDQGDDRLTGGEGQDQLAGNNGADELKGGNGTDQLSGNDDNDTLSAEGGNDTLQGGPGDDTLQGSEGNEILDGNEGNDTITPDQGTDTINGGPGTDTASYQDRSAPVTLTLDNQPNDGQQGESDNLATDIENLTGSQNDDTLIGSPNANLLNGAGGNDTLDGGPGPDTLIGGDGTDTTSYQNRGVDVNVTLDNQPNDGQGGEGDNAQTENVQGGKGNDILQDSPTETNTLYGNDGNDTIRAAAGNETSPPDTINCGLGRDSIQIDDQDQRSADCETIESSGIQIASIKPKLKLLSKKLAVDRRGNTTITLRCADGTATHCTGTLNLTAVRAGRKTTIGKRSYSVRLNTTQKLKLKLSRKGLVLLRKQRKHKLNVTMALSGKRQKVQLTYQSSNGSSPLEFQLVTS